MRRRTKRRLLCELIRNRYATDRSPCAKLLLCLHKAALFPKPFPLYYGKYTVDAVLREVYVPHGSNHSPIQPIARLHNPQTLVAQRILRYLFSTLRNPANRTSNLTRTFKRPNIQLVRTCAPLTLAFFFFLPVASSPKTSCRTDRSTMPSATPTSNTRARTSAPTSSSQPAGEKGA